MKHGDGLLSSKDGVMIEATWSRDKKSGPGIISTKGKREMVDFYNDLQVKKAAQNPDCFNWMILNMITSAAFMGSIAVLVFY